MIKVGIIGIRGLPARYGAFDQFVNQFVNYTNLNKKKLNFIFLLKIPMKKLLLKMFTNFIFIEEKVFLSY